MSSELSLELAPTCAAHPDTSVVGTVRSYFIRAPGRVAQWPTDDGGPTAKVGLAAMMATGT